MLDRAVALAGGELHIRRSDVVLQIDEALAGAGLPEDGRLAGAAVGRARRRPGGALMPRRRRGGDAGGPALREAAVEVEAPGRRARAPVGAARPVGKDQSALLVEA